MWCILGNTPLDFAPPSLFHPPMANWQIRKKEGELCSCPTPVAVMVHDCQAQKHTLRGCSSQGKEGGHAKRALPSVHPAALCALQPAPSLCHLISPLGD